MNGDFHPPDCVARLPGIEGEEALISVEDCINQARISLERYVEKC